MNSERKKKRKRKTRTTRQTQTDRQTNKQTHRHTDTRQKHNCPVDGVTSGVERVIPCATPPPSLPRLPNSYIEECYASSLTGSPSKRPSLAISSSLLLLILVLRITSFFSYSHSLPRFFREAHNKLQTPDSY